MIILIWYIDDIDKNMLYDILKVWMKFRVHNFKNLMQISKSMKWMYLNELCTLFLKIGIYNPRHSLLITNAILLIFSSYMV